MALDPAQRVSDETLRSGSRIGAVVSQYHAELCGAMASSARAFLVERGLSEADWLEVAAPGAFEIPLLAQALARRDDVDAVLCFGLVLQGETKHDEFVAGAAADGVLRVSLETGKPVLFGVLTCPTVEHARARALPASQGGRLDKGREVAAAALRALRALDEIAAGGGPS